jgi:hypothetical protein
MLYTIWHCIYFYILLPILSIFYLFIFIIHNLVQILIYVLLIVIITYNIFTAQ